MASNVSEVPLNYTNSSPDWAILNSKKNKRVLKFQKKKKNAIAIDLTKRLQASGEVSLIKFPFFAQA